MIAMLLYEFEIVDFDERIGVILSLIEILTVLAACVAFHLTLVFSLYALALSAINLVILIRR